VYALLQRVHVAYLRLVEAIENDHQEHVLVSRLLMCREHSSFLAAVRLAISGQVYESSAVLRCAIEQAWYALHIAKDPAPPNRAKVWLQRNQSNAAKSICKNEFTVTKVRSTHESIDSKTASHLQERYELMIDFGAHPNQFGVASSLRRKPEEEQPTYDSRVMAVDTVPVMFALRMAVEIALDGLKVFQLIYPERFMLVGLDRETETILNDINTAFRQYVPNPAESATG
jgi:hypothetical protein